MVKRVVDKIVTEAVGDDGSRKVVEKKVFAKDKKMTAREREELLVENFVGVQHAMTNLSIKFGILSDNISKLLQVFEEAARGFMSGGRGYDKDMLNKIDSLLEQNKTIAKGLVLMEGKLRGRSEEPPMMQHRVGVPPVRPRPLPSA
jgi:hypothetical protein